MACKICEYIADEIDCAGCSNEIVRSCEESGDCDGVAMLQRGSVDGHKIPPMNFTED